MLLRYSWDESATPCRVEDYLEIGAVLSSMFNTLSMASELGLCKFALRKTLFFKRVQGDPYYRWKEGQLTGVGNPDACQAPIQLEPAVAAALIVPASIHEEDDEVSLYFAYLKRIEKLHMVLQPGDGSVIAIACQIHEVEWIASRLRFPKNGEVAGSLQTTLPI